MSEPFQSIGDEASNLLPKVSSYSYSYVYSHVHLSVMCRREAYSSSGRDYLNEYHSPRSTMIENHSSQDIILITRNEDHE